MRKFAKQEDEAEVNMTPMLDIVFIMLIFFIVTASFVKESGIEINKAPDTPPQDQDEPDPETRAIAFIVDASNNITHNFQRVSLAGVPSIIKKNSVERPRAPVIIQLREGAHTRVAMTIYDAAQDIGIPVDQIIMMEKR